MANEKRLIDADELMYAIRESDEELHSSIWETDEILDEIRRTPTVDAVEVVHGRWVLREDGYHCSNCDIQAIYTGVKLNYCPNCGAKMDG